METCLSLQQEIVESDSYWMMSGNASMFLGYHGISCDSSQHTADFKAWVDGSYVDGLVDNFVDENSRFPTGSNNDACAAALMYGENSADRESVYHFSGFKDYKTVASYSGQTSWVLDNCDPDEGKNI